MALFILFGVVIEAAALHALVLAHLARGELALSRDRFWAIVGALMLLMFSCATKAVVLSTATVLAIEIYVGYLLLPLIDEVVLPVLSAPPSMRLLVALQGLAAAAPEYPRVARYLVPSDAARARLLARAPAVITRARMSIVLAEYGASGAFVRLLNAVDDAFASRITNADQAEALFNHLAEMIEKN